jgi:hypothetical protein
MRTTDSYRDNADSHGNSGYPKTRGPLPLPAADHENMRR